MSSPHNKLSIRFPFDECIHLMAQVNEVTELGSIDEFWQFLESAAREKIERMKQVPPKSFQCEVCGEVFESDEEQCPICGAEEIVQC